MTIRCSSLPRIMKCPASKRAPDLDINESSEMAELGTAVHSVMARIVTEGLDAVPDDIEDKEVKRLAWNGLRLWQKFRDVSTVLYVETELHSDLFSGHPDVVFMTEDSRLAALDWKTGYVQRSYDEQVQGYLYLADYNAPQGTELNGYIGITGWLRWRETYDVTHYNQSDLADFRNKLIAVMKQDTYSPGSHCEFCPMFSECDAVAKQAGNAISIFTGENLPSDPASLGKAYYSYKTVGKYAAQYDRILRQTIDRDGMVPLPDGSRLVFEEKVQHPLSNDPKVLEILRNRIGDAAFKAVKISKQGLSDAVKSVVDGGKGASTVREIMTELDENGLIEEKVVKQLTVRKGME